MFHMRPGTKIHFWSPGFRNRPEVSPPGLLRLVGGLSFLSVVGMLVFVTAKALTGTTGSYLSTQSAIYVAAVHFVLPLGIGYTVGVNSPASRILIAAYCAIVYAATLSGRGYLGNLDIAPEHRLAGATVVLVVTYFWLYASPRMRLYYALLRGTEVPEDLRSRAQELAARPWINPRIRTMLDRFSDFLELVVIFGFIIISLYAYWRTGG